jgi:hypothetical protein
MPRAALRRTGALCFALAALSVGAAHGSGALVEVDNLILRADGGFQPRRLPQRSYAPIDFHGHVDFAGKDGGPPPMLRQAIVDFDRDGRLSFSGLPVCAPQSIADASTEEARAACRGAIVGSGHIEAVISLDSGPVQATSPLSLFNGPRLHGNPTVVVHARTTVPATQTYAIVVPIVRRHGAFRYRAVLDVPPIAGGRGAITHIDVKVGRRYSADGRRRSYVSARCSDGILQTHGRFTFEDGTVVDGSVEKFCRAR